MSNSIFDAITEEVNNKCQFVQSLFDSLSILIVYGELYLPLWKNNPDLKLEYVINLILKGCLTNLISLIAS